MAFGDMSGTNKNCSLVQKWLHLSVSLFSGDIISKSTIN